VYADKYKENGMATPIPPFLAEKEMVRQSKMISAITDLKYLKKKSHYSMKIISVPTGLHVGS